ncbi:hypothetical protein JW977_03220 [Candidatus Falkowbacteria bacterium]|nr:hypothetical protein [Candidatus Falkowbacteria bacterium]
MIEKIVNERFWEYRYIQHCVKVMLSIVKLVICSLFIANILFLTGICLLGLITIWQPIFYILALGTCLFLGTGFLISICIHLH